jgi:ribosomal protein S8
LLPLAILMVCQKLVDRPNFIFMPNLKKTKNKKRSAQHMNFSLKQFFQAYSHALQSKAQFFEYPLLESRLVHEFLQCLLRESRIAAYQFIKEKQKVSIFFSYDVVQKTPLNPKFIFYSASGRTHVASLKTLQSFNKQNPTALTLIGSPGGILSLKDCLQRKCGGQFLVTMI